MKKNNLTPEERALYRLKLLDEIDELNDKLYALVDHHLKTLPLYFDAVSRGTKCFEVRWNDRDFKKGDIVSLDEWDAQKHCFTGNSFLVLVEEVFPLDDVARALEGYVAFTFRLLTAEREVR